MNDNDTRQSDNVIPLRRAAAPATPAPLAPPIRPASRSGEHVIDQRAILEGVARRLLDDALKAYSDACHARAVGDDQRADKLGNIGPRLVLAVCETFEELAAL